MWVLTISFVLITTSSKSHFPKDIEEVFKGLGEGQLMNIIENKLAWPDENIIKQVCKVGVIIEGFLDIIPTQRVDFIRYQ